MPEILLSPSRIGWVPAVATTVVLLALGEAARVVGWGSDRDGPGGWAMWPLVFSRYRRSRTAAVVASEKLKTWLRPATVLPLVFAPLPMMRPPADLATGLVFAALVWWTLFTSAAVVHARMALRSALSSDSFEHHRPPLPVAETMGSRVVRVGEA